MIDKKLVYIARLLAFIMIITSLPVEAAASSYNTIGLSAGNIITRAIDSIKGL